MSVLDSAYGTQYGQATDEWTDDQSMRCVPALVQGRLKLPSSARALDVGCGTGRDVEYLSGFLRSVTGIDIIGQDAWASIVAATPGAAFERTDLLSYQPDCRYDLVLDNGCFHHQHEAHRSPYLDRAAALTLPDGWFVLSTFKAASIDQYVDVHGRLHKYWTDDELHATLRAAAFDVVDETDIYRPTKGNYYRLSFCRPDGSRRVTTPR